MKRILIVVICAFAVQLGAIEVYKGKNSTLRVFGTLNTQIGYGNVGGFVGESTPSVSAIYRNSAHRFMAGIQGNTKFGVAFTIGGLFGEARLGLKESPVYKGSN